MEYSKKKNKLTPAYLQLGDKNLHFTDEEWSEIVLEQRKFLGMLIQVNVGLAFEGIGFYMERPVVRVADGIVIFVRCDYCKTREIPMGRYCRFCGAEIA